MPDTSAMVDVIHHVADAGDWSARSDASYVPAGYAAEGFIHLCTASQLDGVLHRYYRGRSDLRLLTVETDQLGTDLIWEDTTGRGEDFPHLYGPLPLAAVRSVDQLSGPPLDPDSGPPTADGIAQ